MNYCIAVAVVALLSVLCTSRKQEHNDFNLEKIRKIERPWSNLVNPREQSKLFLKQRAHSFQNDKPSSLRFSRHKVENFVPVDTNFNTQKEIMVEPLESLCSNPSKIFILEFELLTTSNNEKLALTNLIKKCSKYTKVSKKLQNAFLLQSNTKEPITLTVLINNLSKKFQLGAGQYQIFNGKHFYTLVFNLIYFDINKSQYLQ